MLYMNVQDEEKPANKVAAVQNDADNIFRQKVAQNDVGRYFKG